MGQSNRLILRHASLAALALVAGCAHERPTFVHTGYSEIDVPDKRCTIRDDDEAGDTPVRKRARVEGDYGNAKCLFVPVIVSAASSDSEDGAVLGLGRTAARDDLVADIEAILARPKEGGRRSRLLLLSGGGQHGAFGAGLLLGMARANGDKLPPYDIVTGVSTGSIQSTFAFLANRSRQPTARTTNYPAYMAANSDLGRTGVSYLQDLALAYAVDSEAELLHVYRMKNLALATRGSFATMDPLRALLHRLITQDVLEEVAQEYWPEGADRPQRLLLIGVTNEDDGFGYAINLTKIAYDAIARYKIDHDEKRLNAAREIYIESIIASSSVPPGVPAVTLPVPLWKNEHSVYRPQFIDGGARFGFFFHQIGIAELPASGADVDVIVNGNQNLGDWVNDRGKSDAKLSPIGIGLRAVDILTNQSYRASEDTVVQWAAQAKATVSIAYMSNIHLQDKVPSLLHWRSPSQGNLTCKDVQDEDIATLHPLQFQPHYMRCLIEYGLYRAGSGNAWNFVGVPTAQLGADHPLAAAPAVGPSSHP